jgi:hypothetical protein
MYSVELEIIAFVVRNPFGTEGPFTSKMGQGCQLHLKLLASNEAPGTEPRLTPHLPQA